MFDRNRIIVIAIGALVVVAAGATAVLATNNRDSLGPQSPAAATATAHKCSSNGQSNRHGSSHSRHQLSGTISSIDKSHSSFVLKQCDGTSKTVTTSSKTRFEDGLKSFSDLKAGLSVDVEGTTQKNGTFAAIIVHVEANMHTGTPTHATPTPGQGGD